MAKVALRLLLRIQAAFPLPLPKRDGGKVLAFGGGFRKGFPRPQGRDCLSKVFASRRVLSAFFCFCGTKGHRRLKKGLFLIAADIQIVIKGSIVEAS